MKHLEVPADELRWIPDLDVLPFSTTAEVEPIIGTIAQERAIEALRMGIENNAPGFNIFISGITGTGRATTAADIFKQIAPQGRVAPDRAFVHNFDDRDRPRLLSFPRGHAVEFAEEMKRLSRHLMENVPGIFESSDFELRKKSIIDAHTGVERERMKEFDEKLTEAGLALAQVTVGQVTRPQVVVRLGDEVFPVEALDQLVSEEKIDEIVAARVRAVHETYTKELREILKEARAAMRAVAGEIQALIRELGAVLVDGPLEDARDRFKGEGVHAYLDQVREFVLENIGSFHDGDVTNPLPRTQAEAAAMPVAEQPLPLELAVNVILDNTGLEECPMVLEPRPSFRNLFGVIERISDAMGNLHTDFTRIHSGSLLKADGGVLIVNAINVLEEPWVWPTLKNVLRFNQLEIQNPPNVMGMSMEVLSPQPIPVNVKVVLIGDYRTYQALSTHDPDFDKIFKVLAQFDTEMDATQEHITHFAGVVSKIVTEEELLPLDRSGFSELLEVSVRHSGRRSKLSTRFGDIADLLREADYYARKEARVTIDEGTMVHAIQSQKRRHSLMEEKLQEFINNDTIMISTQGEEVGQINGLAVYDMRAYRFGKPARLTASTGLGGGGLINIEREAGLSGQTHDKGVLILAGYLRRIFAQKAPLSFSASIAFEQSYGMIDGDSASSTELYALLSELARAPISQGFAVTGSVNQRGEVQAIGGVNEKIECWYDLCAERGLTGTQGVLIPHQNVPDLQLRQDVVDAVRAGKFRVLAIEHVDQGIEVLTGLTAAEIHARVASRLEEYRSALSSPNFEEGHSSVVRVGGQSDTPPPPPPPRPPIPPAPPPPRDPREPQQGR